MIKIRQVFILIITIFTVYLVYTNVQADELIIPDSSIRLRVIAHSNNDYDQEMKEKIKDYLEENLYILLKDVDSISEARVIINNELDDIDKNINQIFINNNYSRDYNIKFGSNYFPQKEYQNIVYEEGYYESLVIEIGDAKGDNWWCVLFPSYCLMDLNNSEEKEYHSYFYDKVKQIF